MSKYRERQIYQREKRRSHSKLKSLRNSLLFTTWLYNKVEYRSAIYPVQKRMFHRRTPCYKHPWQSILVGEISRIVD